MIPWWHYVLVVIALCWAVGFTAAGLALPHIHLPQWKFLALLAVSAVGVFVCVVSVRILL